VLHGRSQVLSGLVCQHPQVHRPGDPARRPDRARHAHAGRRVVPRRYGDQRPQRAGVRRHPCRQDDLGCLIVASTSACDARVPCAAGTSRVRPVVWSPRRPPGSPPSSAGPDSHRHSQPAKDRRGPGSSGGDLAARPCHQPPAMFSDDRTHVRQAAAGQGSPTGIANARRPARLLPAHESAAVVSMASGNARWRPSDARWRPSALPTGGYRALPTGGYRGLGLDRALRPGSVLRGGWPGRPR
jgi:hypothetical protein